VGTVVALVLARTDDAPMASASRLQEGFGSMKDFRADLSTDAAWEEWGQRDPYFGVITQPKFRSAEITEESKREFFDSGRRHVEYVMQMIKHRIDPSFAPATVLDFGCGVGRTMIPFAAFAQQVVGLDVSPSMLREAQRNCDERKLANVRLIRSDDSVSLLEGRFDLIHSYIVFQHIPLERGRSIFVKLLSHLAPGGVGAIHFCYSKTVFAASYGVEPAGKQSLLQRLASTHLRRDPEMQMNPYNITELLFILQASGVQRSYVEFTDHGGELGIFLYFGKPN
jgi:SAM-dependent methyltransferase